MSYVELQNIIQNTITNTRIRSTNW